MRVRRSSARSGQVEPVPALAAVAVVGLALALYAGGVERHVPESPDRTVAPSVADRVERALANGGVAHPTALPAAVERAPDGFRVNATLAAGGERWAVGPVPPATAETDQRRVSTRIGPGRVRPGRLEVRVWT